MKIRVISDIHNEMVDVRTNESIILPCMEGDEDTILVVAGDLGYIYREDTYMIYLEAWRNRFKEVIYVPGNHDFYFSDDMLKADEKMTEKVGDLVRYSGMWGSDFIIDNVRFVCHPLFCDMGNNPLSQWYIENSLADFIYININGRRLRGSDYRDFYDHAKRFIFNDCLSSFHDGPTVVVTHWTPSYLSVPDRFKGSQINGGFSNDLDDEIIHFGPDVWIHGHTHDFFDYEIGETRIICNPRGYRFERDNGHDPMFRIEV